MKKTLVLAGLLSLLLASAKNRGSAQAPCAGSPTHGSPQMVWVDTDIGDDIDDAFALALLLKSPELRVLGISTAFGDTETRARAHRQVPRRKWKPIYSCHGRGAY